MRAHALLLALALCPHLSSAELDESRNLDESIRRARELRVLMQSDPHRPTYHFVAPEGNANPFDPNGAIYWRGKYHLGFIYQRRPTKKFALDSGHVWGHAVSTDLLHWSLYPDMLSVTEGDKEIGIFSGGSFLSKEGVPHLIYYGVGAKANLIAYSTDDDLKVWSKSPNNPALQEEEGKSSFEGSVLYSVFDPEAWYDKAVDAYYQISGGTNPALFKSKDMRKWNYLGDLIDTKNTMRDPTEDLSGPDFFALGNGKSMLLFISHSWGAQYYIGTFGNDKFTVEQHARMNWPGGSFFAVEQLQDDKGRNIIWGWVIEHKPPHLTDYGWSGIRSLPREVALGSDGRLRINPAEEVKAARVIGTTDEDIELEPNSERTLKARGTSIELQLEISGAEKFPVGVKVFASPDGREETIITYDPKKKELTVDFSKSTVKRPILVPATIYSINGAEVAGYPKSVSEQRAPLSLDKGEPLKLNIFLDRSVIEVFANGIQCVTQVVYPELKTSNQVKVFSGKERVTVKNIQSWTMAETNAY